MIIYLIALNVVGVVCEGSFSGRIAEIANGVVVQRVNRDGKTERHDAAKELEAGR